MAGAQEEMRKGGSLRRPRKEANQEAKQEQVLNPPSLGPPGPCRHLEKGFSIPETKVPWG